MTARDALVAIATLLAPDRPLVAAHATEAHDDPPAYVRHHAARLDERDITEPIPLLPWIAVVNALTDDDLLAEVDWKESPDEVVWGLRRLRSSPRDAWDWFADTEFHVRTDEFLRITAEHLRDAGVALSWLDIDTDGYPLVMTPAPRTTELNNLAKLAGYRVSQFTTYT
jgi:hypothetical protein